jgi:hypothetical protein
MEIPYFPLVQMDFCSAPTCFLMAMMRHNIKLMPQVLSKLICRELLFLIL